MGALGGSLEHRSDPVRSVGIGVTKGVVDED
jgi:hypothetical protein